MLQWFTKLFSVRIEIKIGKCPECQDIQAGNLRIVDNAIDLIHLLTPCQCLCFITYTLSFLVLIIPLRAEGWLADANTFYHFYVK